MQLPGMRFGTCPACEKKKRYIWRSANMCDSCLEEIVRDIASRDRQPLSDVEQAELEVILSGQR